MCVHYIVTVVIPFSISEAMIWFHDRLLMCVYGHAKAQASIS